MKKIMLTIAAALLSTPLIASAVDAWVVSDISLQAGPDTDYPSLGELEAGTPVSIQGCIDGWTWCDVAVADDHGWVPGSFLEENVGGQPVVVIDNGPRIGIPIVSFSIGTYWDRHYHNRPFYSQRQQFESHPVGRSPPRPSRVVATAPRQGATIKQGTASMQGGAATRDARRGTTTAPQTNTQTTAQRPREEQQRAGQTAQNRQPSSAEQQKTEQQRRSAQTRPEQPKSAKPTDAAPQMMPQGEQKPTAERPQPRQRQTQVARSETPKNESKQKQQGPKAKDELKKSDNKKKDNQDNGGGR